MNVVPETTEVLPHWQDVLYHQGRTMTWLAKVTGRSYNTVQKYRDGSRPIPDWWLEQVSAILGVKVGGRPK